LKAIVEIKKEQKMKNKEDISQYNYLAQLLKKGMREDGRKPFEYRDISIETDVVSQANGSARVKMGNTEIIVGVKVDVATPYPDSPNDGVMMVNNELSPLSSPDFEFGPPRIKSIELARVVDRTIRESGTIDTAKLCITPGEKVWMVFIDMYPVNSDENLFDAGALGAIAALKTVKLPEYDKETGKVNHKTRTKNKLPLADEPLLCTFGKINGEMFVDPTKREYDVLDARLSIGINKKGDICAMQKGGESSFTTDEVMTLVDKSVELGKKLRKHI
jgi:exosome complex component RRP42